MLIPSDDSDFFIPPATEHKERLSVELIKFATALTSAFVVVSSLRKDYPWAFKSALILCGCYLFWLVIKRVWRAIRWLRQRSVDKAFVAEEHLRLQETFNSFLPFAADHDSRSIRQATRNASAFTGDIFNGPVGADFAPTWIKCFGLELNIPPKNVRELLTRCQQFSRLVEEFSWHYPVRTQRMLENKSLLQPHVIESLEHCREDFNAYLRDFEKWSRSVAVRTKGRLDHPEWMQLLPVSQIDKVKSFARGQHVTPS